MTNQISEKTSYEIDPAHTTAAFVVRHLMIAKVRGLFAGISGTIDLERNTNVPSSVQAAIDATSIDTREAQRDAHLKSADFFEVEKYPTMSFKSTQVKPDGDGGYKVTGEFTLHGVTKQVTFSVDGPSAPGKDPWGNTRIGLSATTKINRKDFGLNWNAALEAGGILVGEDVHITVEAEFIKA